MFVSRFRNVSVSEISAVNLIVGWCLFASLLNELHYLLSLKSRGKICRLYIIFKISVSTLAMRNWQWRLPFLYPRLHHGFVGRVFYRAGMNFLLPFELSLNQILRCILPTWMAENDNVQSIDFATNFGTSQPATVKSP